MRCLKPFTSGSTLKPRQCKQTAPSACSSSSSIAGRCRPAACHAAAATCWPAPAASMGAAAGAAAVHQGYRTGRCSRTTICRCSSTAAGSGQLPPLVVVEGDVVTFHMVCKGEEGEVMESSREAGEPLSFEIGAGDITGNPLFQAFDGALRGLGVGDFIELEISGGDWKQELLFTVPRDHPEIERLEGRYKNLGGLHKDLAVELANGSMAVVVEATPEYVKLDANNMMSGKKLLFELEVLGIERPDA